MKKLILIALIVGLIFIANIHPVEAKPKDPKIDLYFKTYNEWYYYFTLDYKIWITIGHNDEVLLKEGHIQKGEDFTFSRNVTYTTTKIRIYCSARDCSKITSHVGHYKWTDYVYFTKPDGQTWHYYVYNDGTICWNTKVTEWYNGYYNWGWCRGYVTPYESK